MKSNSDRTCVMCGNILRDDEEIEANLCFNCLADDGDPTIDDDDDYFERQHEELMERCVNCSCGSWQIIGGEPQHIADCSCGAE